MTEKFPINYFNDLYNLSLDEFLNEYIGYTYFHLQMLEKLKEYRSKTPPKRSMSILRRIRQKSIYLEKYGKCFRVKTLKIRKEKNE